MRQYKINSLIVLFFFIICIHRNVLADIMPDTRYWTEIIWCYDIINMDDYPEYTFLYQTNFGGAYTILNQENRCFYYYKFAVTSIYAIKTDTLNSKYYLPDDLGDLHNKIIRSDIKLPALGGAVRLSNPLRFRKIELKIDSIDEDSLIIFRSSVIYYYDDDSEEILPIINQDSIPEPSRSYSTTYYRERLWFILLPIGAFAGILVILVYRKRNK